MTERGYRLGLYNGAENTGVVLGPLLGGGLLALTAANYQLAFIVAGAIGVCSLLMMMVGVPRDAATNEPAASASGRRRDLSAALRKLDVGVREIIADPQIRLVSLVEAILWMGIGSMRAYLPIYALTIHLSTWQIGALAAAQGVSSIWSRPIMGRQSDRLNSRKPLIMVGTLFCIATLIAIPYFLSFSVLLGLSIVFGLGTAIVTPSSMAMIGDLVTKGNYGSAMGVFGSLWDTGHAGGPVVFGFLLVALGYRTSWLVMAAVMPAALIVFLWGTRHSPST